VNINELDTALREKISNVFALRTEAIKSETQLFEDLSDAFFIVLQNSLAHDFPSAIIKFSKTGDSNSFYASDGNHYVVPTEWCYVNYIYDEIKSYIEGKLNILEVFNKWYGDIKKQIVGKIDTNKKPIIFVDDDIRFATSYDTSIKILIGAMSI
jgi:hypothetical protein